MWQSSNVIETVSKYTNFALNKLMVMVMVSSHGQLLREYF